MMNKLKLQILSPDLLEGYANRFDTTIGELLQNLNESELSADTFSFYSSVSAVFSSKIEGEDIELDSCIKHKMKVAHFLPGYTRKIDDL